MEENFKGRGALAALGRPLEVQDDRRRRDTELGGATAFGEPDRCAVALITVGLGSSERSRSQPYTPTPRSARIGFACRAVPNCRVDAR